MYKLSNNYKQFVDYGNVINPIINEIECILVLDDSKSQDLNKVLPAESDIREIKMEALDYLISYANFVLKDNVISEEELYDFTALKRVFRIEEGDFMKFKSLEVLDVLKQQFLRMYSDNFIDKKEAITNVKLQIMFDLSFDEFEKLKQDEVISALIEGADPRNLDISKLPKGFEF